MKATLQTRVFILSQVPSMACHTRDLFTIIGAMLCLHVKVWWALPHGGEGQVMATVMEIKPTFEIFCISNIYEELLLPVLYARWLPLIIVITDRLFLYLYFVIVGKYIRYFRLSF